MHLLRFLTFVTVTLGLTSCIAIDPSMMGPMGGGGYAPVRPQYDQGYDRGGYDDRYDPRPSYGSVQHNHRPTVIVDDHDHDRTYHGNSGSHSGSSGGPRKWYDSGYWIGVRDRKEGKSCNAYRHPDHYDGKTRGEFAEGYEAGYSRGR
jgi:hypothetical protein